MITVLNLDPISGTHLRLNYDIGCQIMVALNNKKSFIFMIAASKLKNLKNVSIPNKLEQLCQQRQKDNGHWRTWPE